MTAEIAILFLLFTKHLFFDFPLQNKYQWSNKGTYGHFGGILHSGLHGTATALIFTIAIGPIGVIVGLIDSVVHYHIDWAKMNINKHYGWGANTHPEFWTLLGIDQYLHALTYLLLVSYFI